MRALDVWLYGRLAGRLEQVDGRMRFSYAADYREAGRAALSCALPLEDRVYEREAQAFFGNLLPEGEARTLVARRLGVSPGNDFGLLYAIGGDCAGAVSLLPPGSSPETVLDGANVRWLDDAALAAALDELPRRPLLADPDEGIRLSLAGAQDKLPVVMREGQFGIPLGRTPSTHIVKTPIVRFDDTVTNEAFCLALARELRLDAAAAELREADGREFLLVERYDRRRTDDGGVERLHQEDFCQALSIPPQLKYESEGGPGLSSCFDLVRRASVARAEDALALVDAVTLNFLIGNHDAHGKNFSLLIADRGASLAPLYDLVSTAVYPGLDRKMAMKLGGEYRPDYVRRRHLERFASEAGLGVAATLRRMRATVERAISTADGVAADLRDGGRHRPVVDRVLGTIATRAALLRRELG